jgi:hypothetical protein
VSKNNEYVTRQEWANSASKLENKTTFLHDRIEPLQEWLEALTSRVNNYSEVGQCSISAMMYFI